AVMFVYSPFLTFIVVGAFPFYIAISAGATPLFRRRLDEKFARGAENQAFLVESVTGVETLKAMAVEPQMQRRWEEQLAGYVAASFRVLSLGNVASQSHPNANRRQPRQLNSGNGGDSGNQDRRTHSHQLFALAAHAIQAGGLRER